MNCMVILVRRFFKKLPLWIVLKIGTEPTNITGDEPQNRTNEKMKAEAIVLVFMLEYY